MSAKLAKRLLKIALFFVCTALFLHFSFLIFRAAAETKRQEQQYRDRLRAWALTEELRKQLDGQKKISFPELLQPLLAQEPRLLFLLLDQGNGQTLWIHEPSRISRLPGDWGLRLSAAEGEKTASAWARDERLLPPFLDLVGLPLTVPKTVASRLQFAFALPGQRNWDQIAGQVKLTVQGLAAAGTLFALASLIGWALSLAASARRFSNPRPLSREEEKIDLLAADPAAPASSPIPFSPAIAAAAPPAQKAEENGAWVQLYNELDLNGWRVRGNAYANNESIVVVPKLASLVRQGEPPRHFLFRLQGCKISGQDGLIVLFPLAGRSAVWVLGGWGNRYSELAKVEGTRRPFSLERLRWYSLEIHVEEDSAAATIDGAEVWRVDPRHTAVKDFSSEFLPGLGFGSYNTLCKYRSIAIKELPKK